MIEIRHRHTGDILKSLETLRGANLHRADLSRADLSGANLSGANLHRADLSRVDLSRVDLRGVIGNMKEIKSLQLEQWFITYTKDVLQIGCQLHSFDDWWNMSDEDIAMMDSNALPWWKKYKQLIQQIVKLSPAE